MKEFESKSVSETWAKRLKVLVGVTERDSEE